MTTENTTPAVSAMLRMTGANTAEFMNQVAAHLEKLELELVAMQQRVAELEKAQNDTE